MKILNDFEQGSPQWLQARAGIPTASEFGALITDKFAVRKGAMVDSYIDKKLAEWWLGGPLPSHGGSFAMEQGQILEEQARPWYELEYNCEVGRVGFITTDDGMVGCSPDGWIAGDRGLEIKCPQADTHVGYLLDGILPEQYGPQVQGSMWVTGAKSWRFLSYRRGFPALVITVESDPVAQQAITDALTSFLVKLDVGKRKLIELNGGEPKRATPQHGPVKFSFEDDDRGIIP